MNNTIKAILTVHSFGGSMMEAASSMDYIFDDIDYAKKVERELNDDFISWDIDAYVFSAYS